MRHYGRKEDLPLREEPPYSEKQRGIIISISLVLFIDRSLRTVSEFTLNPDAKLRNNLNDKE